MSGLSSVNNSTLLPDPQSTQRRTRRRFDDSHERDSDEDDTDDEDQYEVDFTQNFWESRRVLQEMIAEDVLDENQMMDDDDASAG
jgi:hypothetical protein